MTARRAVIVLAAPAALASACTTTDNAGPGPQASGPAAPPASTAPASSAPASPPANDPADGTDAKACRDGKCQILVRDQSDFALNGKFSLEGILITFTEPNTVRLDVGVRDGAEVHAMVTGTGHLALSYGLTVTVERTSAAGALVRVNPAKNDPKNHRGTGTEGFALWSGS
jgi:hypothetical protein